MGFAVDRIDHVVINCRDMEVTVDWYVRVLGMSRGSYGDGRTAYRAPSTCASSSTRIPTTSQYCRDPDGNLIEVASYRRAD